ncbi:replication initiation protein [Rhodobacter sp. NSM]|uniref:replication initiation protein n=1 Tax=Rhodobacter sp. NSM TaxID=3457501 RepID=UPI003FD239FE
MLKPAELIELRGVGPLTLHDRRLFNQLIEAAWGPQLGEPGREFTVATADLKLPDESNTRLVESIERLMRTIVVARGPDGAETRLQLLGTNTIRTTVNSGTLTYSFPPKLAELVRDSSIFAKLDHAVMRSFSSKYAFALYEAISRRIRLRHVCTEEKDIAGMRELLGVEPGKLDLFKNLQKKAIEPALTEVNAITPYNVTILPKKEGKKVVGFIMGWAVKDEAGLKEAYAELNRPRVGRKERLYGTAETSITT